MKRILALTLAAGLGIALASSAQAQNYAPSVNDQQHEESAGLITGRSVARPSRANDFGNPAPLGYEGAVPTGD